MRFEWDDRKAAYNFRKHRVSFEVASTVFAGSLALSFDDPDHSADEQRLISIGESDQGRVLFVSHTDRNDTTRIISARVATRRERQEYESER